MSKPVSKLGILFVFAILIPGTILTYFSIQNITNQKELTENRFIENQNELAAELIERFQQILLEHAASFFYRYDSLSATGLNTMISLDSSDYCVQSFIINKNGQFIWPNYYDDSRTILSSKKSNSFALSFSQAEKSEFSDQELNKATELYQNVVEASKNNFERATALNALARVLFKRGFINQALRQYRILATRYGSIIDDSGYPFAYYVLNQLIRLPSNNRSKQIYNDINNIFTRILDGQIPLTDHTNLLIDDVSDWHTRENLNIEQSDTILINKIKRIRNLLSFISVEGKAIVQYVTGEAPFADLKVGHFSAIEGNTNNRPYLILLNERSENNSVAGFKVHLNNIKKRLLNAVSDRSARFELEIKILPRKSIPQTAAAPLSTIRELSPLTPWWRLWLYPKNPTSITQYITKQRWTYGIAITLLLAGMFLGIFLVLRDVSREQKYAQMRSDFVANVTHELKTPLTSIRMFAETMRLERIENKSEQQEFLSIIVNESERLTRLINTVLDISKIDLGEKHYLMEPINLSSVLQKALAAFEYWMKEQGFNITADIEPDIRISADGDAIEQAVLNLINNAMKYSDSQKEITVRLHQEENSIYIEVRDRGIGISESEMPYIFNKYYRAHLTSEKAKGGSGLGLTVVKHIVDAHNGRIELTSKVNEGSTFRIILPKTQIHLQEERDLG